VLFNEKGVLEPGTHRSSFPELKTSILVEGDGSSDNWNKEWRLFLVNQAEILVRQLWQVGVNDIFLDGSFVENKDHPNDIDGYFDPHLSMLKKEDMEHFQKIISELNSIDPHKIWTWDPQARKKCDGFAKAQLPMWLFYRVELYPHLNQGTGIADKFGYDLKFPSAFRQSRSNFEPKGIVQIVQGE
jgi:hypothetical protein